MKWKTWFVASAALGLVCAQPGAATAPEKDDDAAAMAALTDMFKAEPLTAEQQARLPAAKALMMQIMPPGTMAQMYRSMFKRIMDPIMKMAESDPATDVAKNLGQDPGKLELTDEQAKQAAAILDPGAASRNAAMMESVQSAMTKAMAAMEPDMREGMAEAYAVNFNSKELSDIAAFFATPSGMTYARRSFSLASDPHVLSATMKSMPKLMAELGPMQFDKVEADLPQPRNYTDLSTEQRSELGRLTGLSQAQIKAGMAKAAEVRADKTAKGKSASH